MLSHVLTPPVDTAHLYAKLHNPYRTPPASSVDAALNMSSQHRGLSGPSLPPPTALPLPDSQRGPPSLPAAASAAANSFGQLPPAPHSWHSADQSMRDWLMAKAEEDRRRQEEEKTRQEELRLEQRRTEHSILRNAIEAGVPAHLVPVIFAGLGSAPLASLDADMLRQLVLSLQQPPAALQPSPDLRRDPRQPTYASAPPPPPSAVVGTAPSIAPSIHSSVGVYSSPAYPPAYSSPAVKAYGPPSGPAAGTPNSLQYAAPARSALPRLTTNEPSAPASSSHAYPLQTQDQPGQSPSIYFHHWQPPQTQTQNTPSSQSKDSQSGAQKTSPNLPSKLAGEEVRSSPAGRKRKASDLRQAVTGATVDAKSRARASSPAESSSESSMGGAAKARRLDDEGQQRRVSEDQREEEKGARQVYDPIERKSRSSSKREPRIEGDA